MRNRWHWIVLGTCLLSSSVAHAWSAKGHVLITEMTWQQLSNTQRARFAHYAEVLTDALPVLLQQQLEDAYPGAHPFAKLSPLPDRWRELTLGRLFASLHAPLPAVLAPYRDQTTQTWHFVDRPYPANANCPLPDEVNLLTSLPLLQQAWDTTSNETARALLLVMMTHLIEDAHQPLHMLSRTTRTCRQDAGGNKRLILVGRYRPIKLHQWWDSAGGYLSQRLAVDAAGNNLRTRFADSNSPDLTNNLDLSVWAQEADALAPFIYSTHSNRLMSRPYAMRSQTLACQRLTLASERLTAWLIRLN